jgi:signal peptidase II
VALFALLADQASKAAVLALLHRGVPLPIFPGLFELRLEFNPGAAFSLFIGGRWVFVAVSIAAFLFLPMYLSSLLRAGERHWIYPAGVGLILGGAIGNALDRVFRDKGWVVDFFHAHWGNHSFPVFNVADSCITVGLSALLFAMLFPGCFAAREEE